MFTYKKRNREDQAVNSKIQPPAREETVLVLKLKKEELFDPYAILPHAELNSIVYNSVDNFVEKYKGTTLTLQICTESIFPTSQKVFREVYRAHYSDELQKVNRYISRHYMRVIVLLIMSIVTFIISSALTKRFPEENILSYVIANTSGFCLWEVGYTQFATRDVIEVRKRILRAMNAEIEF